MSKLDDLVLDKPFRINRRFPSGNFKDWTTYKVEGFHSGNRGILIYFHDLKRWVNPPTDTSMESRIIKKIEHYGVEYLADGEEL